MCQHVYIYSKSFKPFEEDILLLHYFHRWENEYKKRMRNDCPEFQMKVRNRMPSMIFAYPQCIHVYHVYWVLKNLYFQTVMLLYWRRLSRVSWTARRSNQSILKKINPEYSLEGLMLKLKLQYFGHLLWRADSLVKTLILEKIEGKRRRGW